MGISQKVAAVLSAVSLLLLSASPAVSAASSETADKTEPSEVLRIEAENAVSSNSTSGHSKDDENASGGKIWDWTVEGGIICLGDYDLTGLQAITLAVAHASNGVEYGFYIDGTKGALGIKIAELIGKSTGNFSTYGEFSAPVLASVPAARLAGTHTLFLKVESTPYDETVTGNNRYGGNIDYVELVQKSESSDIILQAEDYIPDRSNKTRPIATPEKPNDGTDWTTANAEKWLDSIRSGDIFCMGEVDLTDVQSISIAAAHNTGNTIYDLYIDGSKHALGTKIASITVNSTGGWAKFKELSTAIAEDVSTLQTTGTHVLFLQVSGENTYGGNIDYIRFVKSQPADGLVTTVQEYNFVNDINTSKSSSSGYSRNSGKNCIENTTGDEIILAYDNVRFDGLKGISMNYAPGGQTVAEIYQGDPNNGGVLIESLTLDKTDINGAGQWYDESGYRTTPYTLPELASTATDTLYFKLIRVNTYAGNFRAFTLLYEKPYEPADICTAEAEQYVWGSGGCFPKTTDGVTHLDSVKSGDLVYLGRMDTRDLRYITLRAATANQASCTFYADMDIQFDQLTSTGKNNMYTKNSEDAIAGGIPIGQMDITATNGPANNWQCYSYFTCAADTTALSAGEHDIYMQFDTPNSFACNPDYVRFAGVKADALNTVSNMIGAVKSVGSGKVSAPSNLTFNGTATLTAIPAEGYTLAGWAVNGSWRPADGTSLTGVAVDSRQDIQAYFIKTGSEKLMLFYAKGKLFHLQIVAADLASAKSAMASAQNQIPDIYGYEFSAWSESDTDLEIYLGETGSTIPVSAYYKQVDSADYTVSVTGATASHSGSTEPSPTFKARFDDRITVTASGGNGQFRYWLLDGMVVSFDATYTFYVSGDNAVTAVYDTTPGYDSTQTADTVRVMIKKTYVSAEKDQTGTSKWTVIPQIYVPSSAEILEYGVYFAPDNEALATIKATGSLEGLTEGMDYIRAVSSSKTPNRQYMISLRHIKEGRTRQAMAYVTVKNATGDTVTLYSEPVRQIFSATNG